MRALIARVVTALGIATVAIGGGGWPAWAAQVDGNSYVSPTYGYALTWNDEVWAPANEVSRDGVDGLALEAGDGLITLLVTGVPSTAEPAACVDSLAASRAESGNNPGYGPLSGRERPAAGPGAAGGVYGYTVRTSGGDQIPIIQYVECRPLFPGEAIIVITLETVDDPEIWDVALVLYADVIATLRLPAGAGAEDEGDEGDQADERPVSSSRGGIAGNVYTSPLFGYTVRWDPAVWQANDASSEDEVDSLELETTTGFSLVLMLASEGYGGDARGCRDDAGQILGETEGIVSYTPTPNVNDGTPLIGGDAALAFAIYDAVYAEGGDSLQVRVYVQCRTLIPGRAVLAVIWIVPVELFDAELAAFEGLLAGIDTSGAEVRTGDDARGDGAADDDAAEDQDIDEGERDADVEADEDRGVDERDREDDGSELRDHHRDVVAAASDEDD